MELGGCSHDKIFFVGPDKHPRTHGQFVNARYARFTNSNPSSGFASARIGVFWSHSVRSKNWPFVLACLSGPTKINILQFRWFPGLLEHYFFGFYYAFVIRFTACSAFLGVIWLVLLLWAIDSQQCPIGGFSPCNIPLPFHTLEECDESGEGASINAYRILRNWGCNMDRRPQAGGPYWLHPQFRRMRFAFTDVPEPDSPRLHCY